MARQRKKSIVDINAQATRIRTEYLKRGNINRANLATRIEERYRANINKSKQGQTLIKTYKNLLANPNRTRRDTDIARNSIGNTKYSRSTYMGNGNG